MATTIDRRSDLEPTDSSPSTVPGRECYQILVKSCLDGAWSEWFDGLSIVPDWQRDRTAISGCLPDQSALYGLLNKVRDLGLVLIGVTCLNSETGAPLTP